MAKTATKGKPMQDNTEETTKAILTSISITLVEISESLSGLNANIESFVERFELMTGKYDRGEKEYGFVRTSSID